MSSSSADLATLSSLADLSGAVDAPMEACLLALLRSLQEGSLCLPIESEILLAKFRPLIEEKAEGAVSDLLLGLESERYRGLVGAPGEYVPLILRNGRLAFQRYFVASGGLISYGPDFVDQYRGAAGYVDRILKGAKPADLPVQAPTRYELVLNLKAAKALGLDVPWQLQQRADEVIE